MHRIILGYAKYTYWRRNTHYPSFILLYISLSLYLDSFSFLHLPIFTSTSPFPSQSPSPSPSLSSTLSLSPSIKQKTKIIQNGGQQCAAFCLKKKEHWSPRSEAFTRRMLPATEYIFYCKRAILFLSSSKILTLIPLSARRVCSTPRLCCGGRTDSPGGEGDGGSKFWKTRGIGLPSYSKICTLCYLPTPSPLGSHYRLPLEHCMTKLLAVLAIQ
jgi:hypothetical protein